MRRKNRRFVFTGLLMILLAAGFFAGMTTMAPRSTDPAELMRIVGMVSGVVAGLGLALSIVGLIGRKTGAG